MKFAFLAFLFGVSTLPGAQIECRLSPRSVPAYGHVEVRFADTWKVENPDDPRQADITGIFTSPSGREWRVPGFLFKDFERQGDDIIPRGTPEWCVRFTPVEAGRWKAAVRAILAGQTVTGDVGTFEVAAAGARGFLRRSKANPLALEFENGEPLIAIGTNVFPKVMPRRPVGSQRALNVIRYLERTAAAGGTFCRVRVDSNYIPLELTRDAASGYEGGGRYHPQSCWEVDQLVAAAERVGITLQFCIDDALTTTNANPPAHDPQRLLNYFLKQNGGPLDSIDHFWTDPEVRRLFLQKIRYSVARWGASPAVGVWEFFNELQVTAGNVDAMAAWHRDLAREWRELDPYKRPITTSPVGGYKGTDTWWKLFRDGGMDIVEYHTYSFEDLAAGIGDANLGIMKQTDRPLLVGEFGSMRKLRLEIGGLGSDPKFDPAGLHLHNGIWAGGLTGAVGALPWFITNYIDVLDLYHVFTGFSRFAADWKINAGPWRPIQASVQANFDGAGGNGWGPLELATHEAMSRADSDVYGIQRDGSITGGSYVNGFLFGPRAHPDYRRPPTFEVDYPQDGRFVVTVKYVVGKAGADTPLVIELDGREVTRKSFASGEGQGKQATHSPQYDLWNNVYGEEVAIDVPAGKHRIHVDAPGTDRMAVGYRLEPYADRRTSVYRVYAMGLGGEARLWIQNAANTAVNHLHKRAPADKPPATVRIAVFQPGRYEAEWWDTVKGVPSRSVTAEAKDGFLSLDFPGTLSDEACKIRLESRRDVRR